MVAGSRAGRARAAAAGLLLAAAISLPPALLAENPAEHPAEHPADEASAPSFAWDLPEGFPLPDVPADNPMTAAGVELGRRLFHDPRLSGDGKLACSGCHRPELAYTDGRARALGAEGDAHPRSSMSLANVAYVSSLGWDDPTLTRLEDQARVPLLNEHPVEMGVAGREAEVLSRFAADRDDRRAFFAAFPGESDPFTLDHAARALASFQRTLISGDSPYDRWAYGADANALSPAARDGARLFFSRRLACFRCHGGINLSSAPRYRRGPETLPTFHNTGLYNVDGQGAYPAPNTGVQRVTGRAEDMGRFRAPTLRNIALTAPYMHDGSVETLEQVLDHYARGGRAVEWGDHTGDGRENPFKDPLIAGFALDADERETLIAFLHALTDRGFIERAREMAADAP